MRHVDQVLDDDQLLTTVYNALTKRRGNSRTRGRLGTPAEVVLRLLLLKHIRNRSYEVVERDVRANADAIRPVLKISAVSRRAYEKARGGQREPDDRLWRDMRRRTSD